MPERQPPFDFKTKIIPFEQTVSFSRADNDESLEVEIVTDRYLRYGENAMLLSCDRFALNALLLMRGKETTCTELADAVGFPFEDQAFHERLTILNSELLALTGVQNAIERQRQRGRDMIWLSPRFGFIDARGREENHLLERGIIGQTPEGRAIFDTLQSRQAAFKELFKNYASDQEVLHALYVKPYTTDETAQLHPQDLQKKLAVMEDALHNFVLAQKKDEALLRRGTSAYHELYSEIHPRIVNIARKYAFLSTELYEDIKQQCSNYLLEIITDLGQDGDLQKASTDFYAYCTSCMEKTATKVASEEARTVRHVSRKAFKLRSKVMQTCDQLWQKLQAEPTAKQIAQAINEAYPDKEITATDVAGCLCGLHNYPEEFTDQQEIMVFKEKTPADMPSENENTNTIAYRAAITELFKSKKLTMNRKIILSLYAGIWVPALRNHSIINQTKKTFTYPSTKGEFEAIIRSNEIYEEIAELIGFSLTGVASAVDRSRKQARSIIVNPL